MSLLLNFNARLFEIINIEELLMRERMWVREKDRVEQGETNFVS